MNTLTEPRAMRIKQLKGNYLDEEYIQNFDKEWNESRRNVVVGMKRYERLYREHEGFKTYVDSYMKNKDVALSDVLCMRTTRMIAKIYEKELGIDLTEPIPEPPKPKRFTIWKE